MQKFNLLLILTLLTFFVGKAQQFEGGLLAGMDFSQVDGDTYSGYKRLGMLAGGYVKLPLNEKWALRLEMEYIMKGSVNAYNPNATSDTNNVDYLNKTSYIEVPLLLEYNLANAMPGTKVSAFVRNISLFGGFSTAVLLSHKELINNYETGPPYPGFADVNFTVIFGLQYVIGPRWSVDYRWDNSITTIRTGNAPGYIQRFGGKYGQFHNLMALSLFYKL